MVEQVVAQGTTVKVGKKKKDFNLARVEQIKSVIFFLSNKFKSSKLQNVALENTFQHTHSWTHFQSFTLQWIILAFTPVQFSWSLDDNEVFLLLNSFFFLHNVSFYVVNCS